MEAWNDAKKLVTDLEFAEARDPTTKGTADLVIYRERRDAAQVKYDNIVLDAQKAKEIYEAAGEIYLAADKERQEAQEVSVAAEALV